ncbi:alpha/beta hydrolase [Paracoccus sediminis]|uniref:Alpha/beta hydrolase n=1 Tax=Paracoccus sediminis TaxID=1214787 RepID=A0A238UVU2_9RHOB|nr:alpha/beta hydrolase [Paracoccus sediminis]TBN52786.1 alpha/beta hydrolase [Paracoccus sediminis]SNR25857.1 Pimeloyl-ACP methyl ester carboxylesterase [Paracoccus sediminis]
MPVITTNDGTDLHVRDWGQGRPVVLIHGWPLNADSWEYQAVKLAEAGYRVVSYDRRGFGRSGQPWNGYDYDRLADDLAHVMDSLDLEDVTLVGFSMGGGEVARYMSRHGGGVSQAVFVSSVVPGMLKSDSNPDGITRDLLEQIQAGLRKDRPAFLSDFFKDFYGQGLMSGVSQPILDWTLDMAMLASPRATLECVTAFGTTDFSDDVSKINVPTLIVHGKSDKTVPIDATARRLARMLPNAQLLEYGGAPHGLTATHADQLVEDLLTFLRTA